MFTTSSNKLNRKRNINKFEGDTLHKLIFHQLVQNSAKNDVRNVILFKIKVFGSNIKMTTLARYFRKILRALVLRD